MSNNTGRTEVTAGQNQKEVTINDSDGILDAALTEFLDSDYTSADVTLTDDEFQQNVRFNSTNLTVARALNLVVFKKFFIVDNTDGTATLTVTQGSTTIGVEAGGTSMFYADGTTNGLVQLSAGTGNGNADVFDLGFFIPGTTTDAQVLLSFVMVRAAQFPDDFSGSEFHSLTNPTATVTIDIQKNEADIGDISITSGGVATFTTDATTLDLVAGDRIAFLNQATADATLANFSVNLKGTKA